MNVAKQVGLWGCVNPRILLNFVFQLAGSPAGIADEGADDAARALCLDGGFCGRDAECPAETAFRAPPESGEGELIAGDGAAVVDGELAQCDKFFIGEDVADFVSGRLVEDEAEGTVHGRVLGEEDDRAGKSAITQRRICQEQAALEFG